MPACSRPSSFTANPDGEADLLERALARVPIQIVGRRVVDDEQIEIARRRPRPPRRPRTRSSRRRRGRRRAPSRRRTGRPRSGTAGPARLAARAGRTSPARRDTGRARRRRRTFGIDVHVTRDEQIEPAVAVVVAEARAGRPAARHDAHALGDVGERAVAIVAIEAVGPVVRDVEVRPAVVVDVAGRDAEAPSFVRDAGAIGDVGELEVAIVAEERGAPRALGRRLSALERSACRAVDQIDVEPPVVVDVDERDAAGRRVEDERFSGGPGSMAECLEARTRPSGPRRRPARRRRTRPP